jgi:hypothetical protein
MKLAQIYLPDRANDGGSLFMQHRQLQHELLMAWGGWTRVSGTGCWLNGEEKEHKEPVCIYMVAMPAADTPRLRALAAKMARLAQQHCVMIVTPNGDVDFVKPSLDDTQTVS